MIYARHLSGNMAKDVGRHPPDSWHVRHPFAHHVRPGPRNSNIVTAPMAPGVQACTYHRGYLVRTPSPRSTRVARHLIGISQQYSTVLKWLSLSNGSSLVFNKTSLRVGFGRYDCANTAVHLSLLQSPSCLPGTLFQTKLVTLISLPL